MEKWIKKGILAKIAWHDLCQEGRKTRIFVHTICFGQNIFLDQNSENPGKTIKIVVSAEIVQNLKWHLFFQNGVFWHRWKSGFYQLCFWKAMFSEIIIL